MNYHKINISKMRPRVSMSKYQLMIGYTIFNTCTYLNTENLSDVLYFLSKSVLNIILQLNISEYKMHNSSQTLHNINFLALQTIALKFGGIFLHS